MSLRDLRVTYVVPTTCQNRLEGRTANKCPVKVSCTSLSFYLLVSTESGVVSRGTIKIPTELDTRPLLLPLLNRTQDGRKFTPTDTRDSIRID